MIDFIENVLIPNYVLQLQTGLLCAAVLFVVFGIAFFVYALIKRAASWR